MVVETPFDAILLRCYSSLCLTTSATPDENRLALLGQTVLHLDDRYFRGRGCALPIHDTHGSEQGLLEVVARWHHDGFD